MRVKASDLPYRPCVGIVLFNSQGKVFIGERIDVPGAWQLPQGGVDPGENVEQATLRELKEEVGSNNAEIIFICPNEMSYDFPDHLIGKAWNGKYRGQSQTWVALKFLGDDSEINLSAHFSPEFRDWKWVDFHDVPALAVPFKRDTYNLVVKELSHVIDNL